MSISWWHGERIPLEARILGAGGLIPMLAAVAFAAGAPQPFGFPLVHAALVYAAMILSFLGGIYWGFASSAFAWNATEMNAPRVLGLSVLPALAGWLAVFLPNRAGSVGLALAFIAVLLLDWLSGELGYAPPWWMRLRVALTAGMVVLLLLLAVVA